LAGATASDPAAFARKLARPWRIAFAIAALLVTTATHWPALRLGPEFPASDKTLHTLAFGGLTFLLWRTRWLRRRWLLWLVMIPWAALDEITQGIPALNRFISWEDGLANLLGVTVVVAWLWALAPVGGPVNRMRLQVDAFALDRLFVTRRTWAVLALVLAGCALPPAIAWPWLGADGMAQLIAAVVFLWFAVSLLVLFDRWRRERAIVIGERLCFACGASARDATLAPDGTGRCSICNTTVHAAQWCEPSPPATSIMLRDLALPVVLALLIFVGGFMLLVVSLAICARLLAADPPSPLAPHVLQVITWLPPSLVLLIDTAFALVLFALVARLYSGRIARHYDQSTRCRRCRHDLRGTPAPDGVGRCGECGTTFARLPDATDAIP